MIKMSDDKNKKLCIVPVRVSSSGQCSATIPKIVDVKSGDYIKIEKVKNVNEEAIQ